MKLMYTNQNLILVENIKNVLEQEGIHAQVKNAGLSSGFGELSGIDTWPEVWVVEASDYRQAKKIIQPFEQKNNLSKNDENEWLCHTCGENNTVTFAHCWNCQTTVN